jgi:flagellar hook-length control protein FliK
MNTLSPSPQRTQTGVAPSSSGSNSSSTSDSTDFREVLSQQIGQNKAVDAPAGNTNKAQTSNPPPEGNTASSSALEAQSAKAGTSSGDAASSSASATAATGSVTSANAPLSGQATTRNRTKPEPDGSGGSSSTQAVQAANASSTASAQAALGAAAVASAAASSAVSSAAMAAASSSQQAGAQSNSSSSSGSAGAVTTQAANAALAATINANDPVAGEDNDDLNGAPARRLDGDSNNADGLSSTSGFLASKETSLASTALASDAAMQKDSSGGEDGSRNTAGFADQFGAALATGAQAGTAVVSMLPAAVTPSSGTSASQPTVATATVPYQVGSDAWHADVSSHVLYFTQQDIQVAQLHLNPQHLGPLNIEIRVSGNEASVALSAAHEATRQALNDTLPQLHEMFSAHGVNLGSATVGDQTSGSGQSQAGSGSLGSQGSRYGGNSAYPANGESDPQNLSVGISKVQSRSLSMIDTFA